MLTDATVTGGDVSPLLASLAKGSGHGNGKVKGDKGGEDFAKSSKVDSPPI